MPFDRGLPDLVAAFDAGRVHTQNFVKLAAIGPAGTNPWVDAQMSAGRPSFDAHVSTALVFSPSINTGATNNKAIYTGQGVATGQTKHLVGCNFRAVNLAQGFTGSVIIYDLLGFYPLIDGDSSNRQVFDNTLTLPRYTTGDGVQAVMMNHVAASTSNGFGFFEYVDQAGNAKTSPTFGSVGSGGGLGNLHTTVLNTNGTAGSAGGISMPLANGSRGVRSVTAITYTKPMGGNQVICLIKMLATVTCNGDAFLNTEKDFSLHNGFSYPRIFDGAYIWFLNSEQGFGAAWFGDMTFAWG